MLPCRVNLIRHAERYQDKRIITLAPDGYERAGYIAKCVGNATARTLAFPLGPPTRLMASVRPPKHGIGESIRPFETLLPLARTLSLPIANYLDMHDVGGFVQFVQGLQAGETLCVVRAHPRHFSLHSNVLCACCVPAANFLYGCPQAWQHQVLAGIVNAMGFEGLAPTAFPRFCNYSQWTEPDYAMDPEEGNCFDVLWQLVLFREDPSQK